MSPDDLLWSAPQRGGLTHSEWGTVITHLVGQLGAFLDRDDLRHGSDSQIPSAGQSFGFCIDFWSVAPAAGPLGIQAYGTIGGTNYEHEGVEYFGVQGWLYPYVMGQRVATTADGHNHIFLRYARTDAEDNDWIMAQCAGPSAWRSLGWDADLYGEFEGFDAWAEHDLPSGHPGAE